MGNNLPPELDLLWKEARSFIDEGSLEKAIEIYRYALIRYGDDPFVRERANAYLGDVFLMRKQPDLAESYIRKAIQENPGQASHRYVLGYIFSLQGRWESAIREFETALKMDPRNAGIMRGLGWAVYNHGDTLTGLAILHNAHELDPENANILTDLAVAYSSLADFRKSLQYIRTAMELDPGNALIVGAWWNIDYLQHMCHLDEE